MSDPESDQASDPTSDPTSDLAADPTVRIRLAALQLFTERGYGSTTVEAIAAAAHVGVGTIYRRWPDKPALVNDVYSWVERSIIEVFEATPVGGAHPKQQFLRLWTRFWEFSAEHPMRVLFVEGNTHEAYLDESNRALKAGFMEQIAGLLHDLGVGATPELAVSMITGTVVQLLRAGIVADADDVGQRLWAALRQ